MVWDCVCSPGDIVSFSSNHITDQKLAPKSELSWTSPLSWGMKLWSVRLGLWVPVEMFSVMISELECWTFLWQTLPSFTARVLSVTRAEHYSPQSRALWEKTTTKELFKNMCNWCLLCSVSERTEIFMFSDNGRSFVWQRVNAGSLKAWCLQTPAIQSVLLLLTQIILVKNMFLVNKIKLK